MSLGSLLSREVKFAEAAVIGLAVSKLSTGAAALEELIDAEAPQAVASLIAAVEKADSVLGPANALVVNGVLSTYESDIEAELTPLMADANSAIAGFVPKVVAAVQAVQNKLQAEALATT
jgi:hypothetical protein